MARWPNRWPRPDARLGAALLLAVATPAAALADAPNAVPARPPEASASVWPRQGGPPQPEVGPRRDPVDPPLLDAGAWNTWVLAVHLNGREISQGSVVLEEPSYGRLVAAVSQLRLWRIRLDETRILAFQGEAYYPLDAIPGAQVSLDRSQLVLTLTVPSAQLLPFDMAQDQPDRPEPVPGRGGFLDYDMLLTAGSGVDARLDGLVELGMFNRFGVLTSGLQASDLAGEPSVTRLDTTFTRDLPDRRESLRLGDSLTNGGSLAQPARFAGMQWGTNFATDPSFVTFPMPAIGGLAEQDSVVDVFVNNLRQATGQVPAGPFRIDNVPVVTGAGEVQLVVRDLLGRERIVTQPYYVSARLLRAGLHDYSYAVGFERQRYGERSFAYGDPLATATHRYGFSELLTGEAHADAQPGSASGALGASLRAGHLGVFSGGLGASVDEGSAGGMGQIAYEYQASRFSFGVQTRYATADFVQAGDGGHRARRVDQLNLGFDLKDLGRVGLLALNQDNRDRETARSLAATYSLAVGPGTFLLRGAQFLEPETDWVVTATYALPLGGTRSASVEVERGQHGQRARAQYRQGRGASDLGLDYRLAAEVGDEARSVDARFSYQTVYGAGELDVEHFDGDDNLRAGISGSVGFIDGVARPSRRIGRSFGMVATPGFPDVRVYLDNREVGRTDKAGYLMLPALRPYEANRVRLEVEDLPLDARIGSAEAVAVPFERAGVAVDFNVRRERQATARLLDGLGGALPPGLQLASGDGAATAWVAKSGFSRVVGSDEPADVAGRDAAQRVWTCTLPAVPADVPLPDLGVITCR